MQFSDLTGKILMAAVFTGCAAYAVLLSLENYSFATVVRASRVLKENDREFSLEQLSELTVQADKAVASHDCRSDILGPGLTVYLAFASRQNQIKDYDGWAKAIERTDAYIKHMIKCLPADGNVWIREAMISQSVAENPKKLADQISIGASLGPNELGQVRARIALLSRVSLATREATAPVLDMDIRTTLNYGDRSLVTMLYASPALRPLAESTAAALNPERRIKIERFVKGMAR